MSWPVVIEPSGEHDCDVEGPLRCGSTAEYVVADEGDCPTEKLACERHLVKAICEVGDAE